MKTLLFRPVVAALVVLTAAAPVSAATTTASRVSSAQLPNFPHRTSGVIWGNGWRGSGTVAVNPKIAVSCAHVVYHDGRWLQGFEWAAAHHSAVSPSTSPAKRSLRGYWHWTNYAGGLTASQFHLDYIVHYGYGDLASGAHSGSTRQNSNSAHPLNQSNVSKMIVGYPGFDAYYQNSVGPFTSVYRAQSGHYMWNASVRAGGGMSGGGVFAFSDGQWRLAGVHVSGDSSGGMGAGVRALNDDAYHLINLASQSAGVSLPATTRTVSSTAALSIRDNSTTWAVRNLVFSGMPGTLTTARLSMYVEHSYRGDLEIMLTSPQGRTVMLHQREGGSVDDVYYSERDLSSSFAGSLPNGTWKLSLRDRARGDVGRLKSVSLSLTSL